MNEAGNVQITVGFDTTASAPSRYPAEPLFAPFGSLRLTFICLVNRNVQQVRTDSSQRVLCSRGKC